MRFNTTIQQPSEYQDLFLVRFKPTRIFHFGTLIQTLPPHIRATTFMYIVKLGAAKTRKSCRSPQACCKKYIFGFTRRLRYSRERTLQRSTPIFSPLPDFEVQIQYMIPLTSRPVKYHAKKLSRTVLWRIAQTILGS